MNLSRICLKTFLLSLAFLLCMQVYQVCAAAQPLANVHHNPTTISAVIDTAQPSSPGGLTALHRTYTAITLSWSSSSDNVGVKGYYIFRDGKKIATTTKNTYTNKGLVPGRRYEYFVKAYDAIGNISESSIPVSISTIPDNQPPTVPASPSVSSVSYTSVTLSWRPSSDNVGVKRYEIYMCGSRKGSTTATNYTCKGLSPGTRYSFTVRAVDSAGNSSSDSNTINAGTTADNSAPSAPDGLRALKVTETEVSLSWSPSTDNVKVKKYEIYCNGKKIGTAAKTNYSYRKLLPGENYEFFIKALDTSGLSSRAGSPLKISTLKDLEAPTVPGNLRINNLKKSSVSLSWNPSSDNIKVKGYIIYCNGVAVETASRTTRSVKIPSVPGAGIFWVKAFDQSGNLSDKSNTIMVVAPKQ